MKPSYSLTQLKGLVGSRKYRVTESSFRSALLMGFLDEDIADCIVSFLEPSHFYKTMSADQMPGLMQDVYKVRYEGKRVYLKLQISKSGHAVIVSFKEDESFG
ncbi:MAG: type II toxin-antitoxin system MqsR family toxin [Candidatus Acidiferrum sp.]